MEWVTEAKLKNRHPLGPRGKDSAKNEGFGKNITPRITMSDEDDKGGKKHEIV